LPDIEEQLKDRMEALAAAQVRVKPMEPLSASLPDIEEQLKDRMEALAAAQVRV
jgi:hypothetical protein